MYLAQDIDHKTLRFHEKL